MRTPDEIQVEIDHLEDLNEKRKHDIYKTEDRIIELRNLKSKAQNVEDLKDGIDVNVVKVTGEWPDYLVETDEGFKWWSRDKDQTTGTERITRSFYKQIKKCYDEKKEEA